LVFDVVWFFAIVLCATDYAVVLAEGETGTGEGDGYSSNIHDAFKWELLSREFWGNSDFYWDLYITGEFICMGGFRESAGLRLWWEIFGLIIGIMCSIAIMAN
jgi:hypothetical protein